MRMVEDDPDTCVGPVDSVSFIALRMPDPEYRAQLDALAAIGGSTEARFVSDEAELRAALQTVLDGVAESD